MKDGFKPISIEKYIKSHIKINKTEDPIKIRRNLLRTLKDYQDGVTCHCGNPIWVIGSAIVGNSCFTCITGDAFPDHDYEISVYNRLEKNIFNKERLSRPVSYYASIRPTNYAREEAARAEAEAAKAAKKAARMKKTE